MQTATGLKKYFPYLSITIFFIVAEVWLLYFTPRSNFIHTFGLFCLLFAVFVFVVKKREAFNLQFCIGLAVILRCIALFNMPVLSDDFFRFVWDGKMSVMHINPFSYTPQEFMQQHATSPYLHYLYANMNSQEYHTIYPPVLQFIFYVSALIGGKNIFVSVLILKFFILVAELGSIKILLQVVKKLQIDACHVLWYILNPLIIIELTGNVHFEAVLVFFFILYFNFLLLKKNWQAAVFWALAICTKMIPLMLAPLLLRYLGLKKFISFGLMSLGVILLLFTPFINFHLINNISSSLRLFFHLFEFNASIFYFIRWIGFHYVDYDIIEETAPILGLVSFIIILLISWWPKKKYSFAEKCLWIFSVYFLFSTMVHPWYASILILLSVLTKWKFPIAFSLLIFISYYPYSLKVYEENMTAVLIEYLLFFIFLFFELKFKKKNYKIKFLYKNNLPF